MIRKFEYGSNELYNAWNAKPMVELADCMACYGMAGIEIWDYWEEVTGKPKSTEDERIKAWQKLKPLWAKKIGEKWVIQHYLGPEWRNGP